jgi:four helix bundle protein
MPTTYEKLVVFNRVRVLLRRVYAFTADFSRSELYGIVSQMRRAATSILSNIAESQGRLTYGEARQLLSQARGSLYEVEAQAIAATDLGFLDHGRLSILRARVRSVARPLAGFIRWTQERESEAKRKR